MHLPLGPIHPLLREARLAASYTPRRGMTIDELGIGASRLFIAQRGHGSDALASHALAICRGHAAAEWRIVRSHAGRPQAVDPAGATVPISMSASAGRAGVAVAESGRIGLDFETIDRIARNAGPEDDWLTQDERALVATLGRRAQLLEIGCRWIVREAYGKALGRGLLAWREPPRIGIQHGRLRVCPAGAKRALSGWTFSLYRRGGLLIAVASSWNAVGSRGQESADRVPRQIESFQNL